LHVVVGLGNPGGEYEETRHNAGFLAVEALARRLHRFTGWRRAGAMVRGEGRAGRHDVALVKPQTFMNRSGEVVRALLAEGFVAGELLVVCDDVHLPLGRVRLRAGGGTGGHQGLDSVLDAIGTGEFPRLRIGVGPAPPSADLPEFVLAPFTAEERTRLAGVIDTAAGAAYDAVAEGITQAMNQWNRFGLDPVEE
jgi:PTH1 family peptidyl-tRNA hydrolase